MRENPAEMVNAAGQPFGEMIREYRRRCGLSQEQLGALAGVKKNAVGAWEAGRSRPDLASVPVLCRALGIPLHTFFGMEDGQDPFRLSERFARLSPYNRQVILRQMDTLYDMERQGVPQPAPAPGRKVVRLFLNDLSAAAGPVSYIGESRGEMVLLIENELTKRADEIIRISGDSMEPAYHDGDRVLVQHTNRVKEGEIGIFVNADAGYIKEYRRDGLYSLNPKYAPIRFSGDDSVRCIGRVLGTVTPGMTANPADFTSIPAREMKL